MAGMFYSLQEAAEKLGISEEELKQWATDGKLRDFRDGQSVMFKVDEVEALMGQSDLDDLDIPGLEPDSADDDLLDLEPALDLDLADDELEPMSELEAEVPAVEETEEAQELDLDEPLELAPEEPAAEAEEDLDDLMLSLDDDEAPAEAPVEVAEDDLLLAADDDEEPALSLSDTQMVSDDASSPAEDDLDLGDDLLLAETGVGDDDLSDLTNMDTALASEGVDIFGGSEAEFKLSDDSMAETMAGLAETGGASSLEEIEDDVNLDSFGSGSGLLDLSLQADDTSLGGILDEIYTAEDGDGAEGAVEDITEAAESMPMDDIPMEAAVPMIASAAAVAEIPADAQSNFFGGLLFLPLLVLLFTSIAALGGMIGGMSGLMATLKGIIWYITGGLVVLAIILSAVGFTRGGGSGGPKPAKKAKAKREKQPKKPKAKKEKKVKEKKPKRAKKKK